MQKLGLTYAPPAQLSYVGQGSSMIYRGVINGQHINQVVPIPPVPEGRYIQFQAMMDDDGKIHVKAVAVDEIG